MKKSAKIMVRGTVQGVFFRQFVKEHADKLHLVGYVRNLEAGGVEIIAEGLPDSIERLTAIVKKGPQHSQIRHVDVTERKYSDQFKDFKILRI